MQVARRQLRRLRVVAFLVAALLLSFVGGTAATSASSDPDHAKETCLLVCAAVGLVALVANRPTPEAPGGSRIGWRVAFAAPRDSRAVQPTMAATRAPSIYQLVVLQN